MVRAVPGETAMRMQARVAAALAWWACDEAPEVPPHEATPMVQAWMVAQGLIEHVDWSPATGSARFVLTAAGRAVASGPAG